MFRDNGSYFANEENKSSNTTAGNSSVTDNKNTPRLKAFSRPVYDVHAFPRVLTLQSGDGHVESYCRSLLLEKHGFPLWFPQSALGRPSEYLRKGVSIGDVGLIDHQGTFRFYFNIFLPPDHPFHAGYTPREFRPVEPPLHPSEITSIPDYFKPGTIIASKGIEVVRHQTEPLQASFYSKAPEGGILVLPHGASREDMTSTERIHQYIQRNAPHWYQMINFYGDRVAYPNGTLMVVTGYDKAKEYANASFSNTVNPNPRYREISDMRYTWRPDFVIPWDKERHSVIHWYQPIPSSLLGIDISNDDPTQNQCIFLRTLRISLGTLAWAKALPIIPPPTPYITFLMHKRTLLQRCLDDIATRRHRRRPESILVSSLTSQRKHLFHPNFIIAQILLAQFDNADTSLVSDSTWCSSARGGVGTQSNVLKVIDRLLDTHDIVERHGCLTLVPKTSEPSFNLFRHVQKCIIRKFQPRVYIVNVCERYPLKPKK